MALGLVGRGVRALSDHLNLYYRVFKGVDPDSVYLRLPTGGSFEVRNSATNAAVLAVTDAGATLSGATLPAGSVGSSQIADGSIMDADVNAAANINGAKLADLTVLTAKLGDGVVTGAKIADLTITDNDISNTANINGSKLGDLTVLTAKIGDGQVTSAKIADLTIVDGDVATAAAVAVTKLAHVGAGNVLKSTGTQNVGGQVVNADVAPAGTANVAINKLAHVGANNILRSDGTQNVAGQLVNADVAAAAAIALSKLAPGSSGVLKSNGAAISAGNLIVTGDMAANTINGDRIADASITSAKLTGASVPAGSITTTEIADGTITNVDVNANAGIAVSKLAAPTPNVVLAVGGSAPATWQQVVQAMLANGSVGMAQLIAGSATFISTVAVPTAAYAGAAWNTLPGSTIAWTSQGGTVLFVASFSSCYMSSGTANVQFGIWDNNAAGIFAGLGLQNLNSGGNAIVTAHFVATPAAGARSYALAWQSAGGLTANVPSAQFTVIELRR